MSNVKVNGNTYNDVTSVKLALADGTGFATYSEGAVTDNVTNSILDGSLSGNLFNEDILTVSLNCFQKCSVGTLSFPNAVKMSGSADSLTAENVLLPKVSAFAAVPNFRLANISGVLDLSGMVSLTGLNQTFYNATIGTLKIGKMAPHNMCLTNATITNLIWGNDTAGTENNTVPGGQGLRCAGLTVTNAYVADSVYDTVRELMDDGTITSVTNLYKISEWSDE